MTILCATDFSETSLQAAEVAAGLAARWRAPLTLVHALPLESDEIGGEARSGAARRAVGSTADRLAHQSHVPCLVVRGGGPLATWLRGGERLRVAVGVDFSLASDAAWRWTSQLVRAGPCRLSRVHVYWAPAEYARLGLGGVRSYLDPDPDVVAALSRDLEQRFPAPPGDAQAQTIVEPGIGQVSLHLARTASERGVDLMVVGSHERGALARLWEGSVSRGVLHGASMSAVCVPTEARVPAGAGRSARSVLVATDFSPAGNTAVAHAFAQAGAQGKVTLVHVVPAPAAHRLEPHDIFTPSPESEDAVREAVAKLRALLPVDAVVDAEVRVLEARDVGAAVAQAAERLGVDLICIGAHGQHRATVGRVAQTAVERSTRPVLLVHAPRP